MRRLVLVRHGESVWNAERRIQGQACAGLSPRGHGQAAAIALAVAASYPWARLVTSDLQRARETTAPLEATLGQSATVDARLRERSFGAWERRLHDEVIVEDPERWRRWLEGEDVVGEIGGETAAALAERVEPALRDLLATTPDGGVTVVVTHSGPIWQGVHRLLGWSRGTVAGVDNGSVHELVDVGGRRLRLDRWNSVGHLPMDLRTGPAGRPAGRPTGVTPTPPAGA